MSSERRQRNSASGGQRPPAFVKLFVPLPEDQLLAGELELIDRKTKNISKVQPGAVLEKIQTWVKEHST